MKIFIANIFYSFIILCSSYTSPNHNLGKILNKLIFQVSEISDQIAENSLQYMHVCGYFL